MKDNYPIVIEWGAENGIVFEATGKPVPSTNNDILRVVARIAVKFRLEGQNPTDYTHVNHWLTFAQSFSTDVDGNLQYLQKCLAPITYLVANRLTIADLAVFAELRNNLNVLKNVPASNHVQRWFDLISAHPAVLTVLDGGDIKSTKQPERAAPTKKDAGTSERKQEGKFVDLPGAEMGKVVVRFPPEASGYLHIGHAKAALLNQYYQQAFQGKLIMRFDDTNPAKETVEFENVILGDLEMLEIKPDLFTHTSQYFDLMLDYCETLMKEGKAYVDDTNAAQMKIEREQKVESVHRSNSKL